MNPVSEPVRSEGWIAPDGKFYTCEYKEHRILAIKLTVDIYDSWCGEKLLDEKGWIKVYIKGLTANANDYRCTQAQLDTMGWLMGALTVDDEWKENLQKQIRLYDTV